MLRVLSAQDYSVTPWKNGRGMTTDVILIPEGSTHENFDVRISLAPINAEVPFSSFPGIDRYITLIEGHGLGLEFSDDETRTLEPFSPLFFDSVKAPVSRLAAGPVKVLNVMTRRVGWSARVEARHEGGVLCIEAGDICVIYSAFGGWNLKADGPAVPLAQRCTAIVRDERELELLPEGDGQAIVALLRQGASPA